MSSSPLLEPTHFRGRTLTPESPRPLYIPEPSNVPLLLDQTDLILNDSPAFISPHSPDIAAESSVGTEEHADSKSFNASAARRPLFKTMLDTGNDEKNMSPNNSNASKAGNRQELQRPSAKGTSSSSAYESTISRAMDDESGNDRVAGHLSYSHNEPQIAAQMTASMTIDPAHSTVPSYSASADHEMTRVQSIEAGVSNALHSLESRLELSPTTCRWIPSADLAENDMPKDTNDFQGVLPSETTLLPPASLPPRPPPQAKPSIHPNYLSNNDIRSFHQLPRLKLSGSSTSQSATNKHRPVPSLPPIPPASNLSQVPNSLPPPLTSAFEVSASGYASQEQNEVHQRPHAEFCRRGFLDDDSDEAPWGPDVQKKYDEFLAEERRYVTEGLWDRFPNGSRLFVGNLPTERVTKRDLFHLFHKHGRLAQISIKQAYGFVQFLETTSCRRALEAEQGGIIRGRKIHLEVSKPQKNTRQSVVPIGPKYAPTRRSPEHGNRFQSSSCPGSERHNKVYTQVGKSSGSYREGSYREDPARRQEEYPPPIGSSSPRPYRSRDNHSDRSWISSKHERRGSRRSRSPGYDRASQRHNSAAHSEAYSLNQDGPNLKRQTGVVPDVRILVLDDLDTSFVRRVDDTFRLHTLSCTILVLDAPTQLNIAIQQQILDGVVAVVKLSRSHQYSGRIPLLIFDRSGRPNDVRFNEYEELDLVTACELVRYFVNAHRENAAAEIKSSNIISSLPSTHHAAMQSSSNQNNIAGLVASLDGASLQTLLGVLQQSRTTRPEVVAKFSQDLASLEGLTPMTSSLSGGDGLQQHQQAHNGTPHSAATNSDNFVPPWLTNSTASNTTRPGARSIMAQLSKWQSS